MATKTLRGRVVGGMPLRGKPPPTLPLRAYAFGNPNPTRTLTHQP